MASGPESFKMSFRREARRIRALPGFTSQPRCTHCGSQVPIHQYRKHERQCWRDCLSECLAAIDKKMAGWWSTEPRDDCHRAEIDRHSDSLSQERAERWEELMATTPYQPHDGEPF